MIFRRSSSVKPGVRPCAAAAAIAPESPGLHRFLEREDCQRQSAAVAPDPARRSASPSKPAALAAATVAPTCASRSFGRRFATIMDHPFSKEGGTVVRAEERSRNARVTRELTSGRARPSIRTDTRLDVPDARQAAARTRGEVLRVDAITQRDYLIGYAIVPELPTRRVYRRHPFTIRRVAR